MLQRWLVIKLKSTYSITANQIYISCIYSNSVTASWLSDNAFLSSGRGLRFKSRAGQIEHHHCCNVSSKGAVLPGRHGVEMGPANSLHASNGKLQRV